jgi:hypothetical protein
MGRKGSSKIEVLDELDLSADEKKELAVSMHQNSKMEKKQKKRKKIRPEETSFFCATVRSVKSQVARKKQATYKTSFMQRATSNGYHREKLKALKEGKSQETVVDAARMAAAKVRGAINNGLMKEQ